MEAEEQKEVSERHSDSVQVGGLSATVATPTVTGSGRALATHATTATAHVAVEEPSFARMSMSPDAMEEFESMCASFATEDKERKGEAGSSSALATKRQVSTSFKSFLEIVLSINHLSDLRLNNGLILVFKLARILNTVVHFHEHSISADGVQIRRCLVYRIIRWCKCERGTRRRCEFYLTIEL